MSEVLRQLLDNGGISEERCLLILRDLAKEGVCESMKVVSGWTSEDEEEEEFDDEYCRQVEESGGFDIDEHVRIPQNGISPRILGEREPPYEIALFGRLGLHCFNIEKGMKLKFIRIPKYNIELFQTRSYYITVEVKDLVDDTDQIFQTLAADCLSNGKHLKVLIDCCRLKPKSPRGKTN